MCASRGRVGGGGRVRRRSKFGEYLRAAGLLDPDQLEEACLSQSVQGGRIGSNLVELGFVGLEVLADRLAAYHDRPLPPEDWLEAPDEQAITLIPSSLVRRYHFLPLKLETERLHVVLLDPRDDHQLALLGDISRRMIEPYVLPEIRLLYWLETHCGVDRHPRYTNLSARSRRSEEANSTSGSAAFQPLAAGQELTSEDAIRCLATASPPPLAERAEAGRRAPRSVEALLFEEIVLVDEVAGGAELDAVASPAGPGEIATLEAELQGADDRHVAIDLALRLATAFAPSVALFIVRGGLVAGQRAIVDGAVRRIDTILLPAESASLFTQPAVTGRPFRGRPPQGGLDGRIVAALGRADAQEVLIQPVAIRGRVVSLLYADNGADALADTSVAALGALAGLMQRAFERLILDAKQRP